VDYSIQSDVGLENLLVPSTVAVEEQKPLLPPSLVSPILEKVRLGAVSLPVTAMLPFPPPISVVVYLQVMPAQVNVIVMGLAVIVSAPFPLPVAAVVTE
jgi:hypothetical protein